MKNLTVLGSTGSIGQSTLDVIRRLDTEYRVFALAAGSNASEFARQIIEFRPKVAVLADAAGLDKVRSYLETTGMPRKQWPELLSGPQALIAIATDPEVNFVMSAIVGVTGLAATYEAVKRGIQVGLANKEVLVAAGELVMQAARASGTELLPVDSEHNAAHQCLRSGRRPEVSRLILTASGGPFRNYPKSAFDSITPEQALKHPTWKMGRRITIDCATLMNKGFEVIEACWLFDFRPDEVDVVVHPQSTVHAMVEFVDGSVVAQVSATDMRMPIQYALTYPARMPAPVPRLDWTEARTWEFGAPDWERFPLLRIAYDAFRQGTGATCTVNAADEVAVEAFLQEQIGFPAIARVVEETLNRVAPSNPRSIAEVLELDRVARVAAAKVVGIEATETASRA